MTYNPFHRTVIIIFIKRTSANDLRIRQEHAKEPLSTPLEFPKPESWFGNNPCDVRLNFLFFIGENNEKIKKKSKRRKKSKNEVGNDGQE